MTMQKLFIILAVAITLCAPASCALAYAQPYYQAYYQAYYEGYYQGYYQNYYQAFYESAYQGYYQGSYNYATSSSQNAGNYTYTLMCLNQTTQTSTTTTQQITVGLPSCSTPAPDGSSAGSICPAACIEKVGSGTVHPAQTTSLSWCCPSGSTGVTVANSGQGSTPVDTGGALSGSASVGIGGYTLTCLTKGTGTQSVVQTPDGQGTQTLIATPSRLRKGSATLLSWSTSNMSSCALTDQATPGNLSTALSSPGTQIFINQKMTFTLSCTDTYGTTTSSSAVVSLLPGFQER